MSDEQISDFSTDQQEVLKSIRISRIILPVLIGVGVVIYLLWKQFDPVAFGQINWNEHTLFWVTMSVLLLIVRHIAYANRLRVLSKKAFSWKKCVELIFIWEFSSAVSPTSVGGSAVALFVLAQEKLSTAKTTTIVIYTAILDTIFFVGTLPILLLLFGPIIIRPKLLNMSQLDGWGYTFIGAYILMAGYGFLFFYGLFINPKQLKKFFEWVTSFR
ncbi:MAG: lysylphosphatidylglycerol synthase domain-containing protein, partial [Bacteroidota bacterium]